MVLITIFVLFAGLFVALSTVAVELDQLVSESGPEFSNSPPLFSVRYVFYVYVWL
jgi:hypothetical protein